MALSDDMKDWASNLADLYYGFDTSDIEEPQEVVDSLLIADELVEELIEVLGLATRDLAFYERRRTNR